MADKVIGYLMVCEAAPVADPQQTVVSDSNDTTVIQTTLQEGGRVNRNKRLYGTDLLTEAIKAPYVMERLKTKSFYGEAGHPDAPSMQRQLSYDHTRISHIITKVWMEGNLMKGLVETAQTNVGRDMQGLIRQKSIPAFSMRGVGPIVEQKKDYVEIKRPLSLFCYDWVVHPSHDLAYMERVIQEAVKAGSALRSEGCSSMVLQEAVDSFVAEASRNVRTVSDNFEIPTSGIVLSEDRRHATIRRPDGTAAKVLLEEGVRRELNGFLSGLGY
jgi:hypothetical protein